MYMITGVRPLGDGELWLGWKNWRFMVSVPVSLLGLLLQATFAAPAPLNRVAMLQQPGGSKRRADSALVGVNFAIVWAL